MKRLCILIALLGVGSPLISQEGAMTFGIKGGVNSSSFILGKDLPDSFPATLKGKIGWHLGGFLRIGLTENLSLKPEVLFSAQGAKYVLDISFINPNPFDPTISSTNYEANIREYLVLLPVILDYYISDAFDVELGPQLGYLLDYKISDNSKDLTYGSGAYDKFEMALCLGLGYAIGDQYRMGLRYDYGILERNNLKSSVFQLVFDYKL